MEEITKFLMARLAEREKIARAVRPLGYTTDMGGNRLDEHFTHGRQQYASEDGMPRRDTSDPAAAKHFALYGPAEALEDILAKQKIVNDLGGFFGLDEFPAKLVEHTLRLLARPFAGHPDYREEWQNL